MLTLHLSQSIFACAHLYNAILDHTGIRWPELDRVIDLHGGALFANDIPKTPTDCYRRMAHRTGATGSQKHFDKKQLWKMRTGMASQSLKGLVDRKDTIENSLLQLENQIETHLVPAESVKQLKRTQRQGHSQQLNPMQLMSRFEEYLPVVIKDMEIDYITLTKQCNALMKEIRARLRTEAGQSYASMNPGESNDHGYVFMILAVLLTNSDAYQKHQKQKEKGPFEGNLQLQVACRAFEEFYKAFVARSDADYLA